MTVLELIEQLRVFPGKLLVTLESSSGQVSDPCAVLRITPDVEYHGVSDGVLICSEDGHALREIEG